MSTLILGPGEKVVREDEPVWYHSGYSKYGYSMAGKLVLTNKRFAFVHKTVSSSGGMFGFFKKTSVETMGIKINIPLDKVIGAATETRERKKGTLNDPPSLFSKELYNVLIVSLDAPEGVENPIFEVGDPSGWATAIQRKIGGEKV